MIAPDSIIAFHDGQGVAFRILERPDTRDALVERRQHEQPEEAAKTSDPTVAGRTEVVVPDEHVGPVDGERAPAFAPRAVRRDVEHDVVALTALGEVLLRVVDDAIGSDRSEHV